MIGRAYNGRYVKPLSPVDLDLDLDLDVDLNLDFEPSEQGIFSITFTA